MPAHGVDHPFPFPGAVASRAAPGKSLNSLPETGQLFRKRRGQSFRNLQARYVGTPRQSPASPTPARAVGDSQRRGPCGGLGGPGCLLRGAWYAVGLLRRPAPRSRPRGVIPHTRTLTLRHPKHPQELTILCAYGSSGAAGCGVGGVMAWERGRREGGARARRALMSTILCACGSSGDAACGAGDVMAWERGAQGRGREARRSCDVEYPLCLRLQRGCGMRRWGRDGLGAGAQGRGREGAEGSDVDYPQRGRASGAWRYAGSRDVTAPA